MGKVNIGRVILAGLLAGLIINVCEAVLNLLVIPTQTADWLASRNLPDVATSAIMIWVFLAFLLGIMTVWVYAAIRPRFGPGVGTAIMAGLAVFFLAYVYPTAGLTGMGMYPTDLVLITLGWGLVEVLIAAVAGAWAYTE